MIIVDRVTKYYGTRAAVRDLSFEIREGECVGFLGLNGAGKTTALRLLGCLLLPTSGTVRVRGFDAEGDAHEIRKLIGFLPDSPPLYDEMTVTEYLLFAGRLRGMSKADAIARLPEVVRTCALEAVTNQAIGTLSHGYKQRVGIAQAIVHRPALLLLDEPIQGLDPVQIVEMRGMIRALRGRHTILVSSHILSEIRQTCDRILMMHEGRITAEGTEDELLARYGSDWRLAVEARGTEEALRQAVARVEGAGVQKVVTSADGALRAEVSASVDVRAELSRALVGAGLALLGMRRVESGLESVFVLLSRRGADAEPAEPEAVAGAAGDGNEDGGASGPPANGAGVSDAAPPEQGVS